ncbi:MAG: glycosyl hydrolase, partial [Actinobacteria bacterium]|nr:glycosyl hydrolase [Actinomycetota bacterium]NIT95985.1 glycosyl hydrolase [Actinomycetota bacterium]NIU19658.1 glycosyl hydrolase [Actinomycetota bacterium]NIU67039.1 glycosyl hydrolase [Actinomycetota bacterium]NIV56139.1 glycosyl hydrolase [Actinomycetota bacterium]
VSGGDGFYNVIDPTNPDIIYTESQGGNVSRYDARTGESARIRPVARPTEDDEDREYRYNWNAPIVVSAHDPATVYIGANHLMRSRDRGYSWEEASPDLTKEIDRDTLLIMGSEVTEETLSRNDGIRHYGTITAIGESGRSADVLFVGTDDGNVQRTTDGGATWTDLTGRFPGLPERTYVSGIEPSTVEGRVYASFDGHRGDDYAPYVYVSPDNGDSWIRITGGLPEW